MRGWGTGGRRRYSNRGRCRRRRTIEDELSCSQDLVKKFNSICLKPGCSDKLGLSNVMKYEDMGKMQCVREGFNNLNVYMVYRGVIFGHNRSVQQII